MIKNIPTPEQYEWAVNRLQEIQNFRESFPDAHFGMRDEYEMDYLKGSIEDYEMAQDIHFIDKQEEILGDK